MQMPVLAVTGALALVLAAPASTGGPPRGAAVPSPIHGTPSSSAVRPGVVNVGDLIRLSAPDTVKSGQPFVATLELTNTVPVSGLFLKVLPGESLVPLASNPVGRSTALSGSAFRFDPTRTMWGVLLDEDGSQAIESGSGPLVQFSFLAPIGQPRSETLLLVDVQVAGEDAQPLVVTVLDTTVVQVVESPVPVAVTDLIATLQEDAEVLLTWTAQEHGRFHVLRRLQDGGAWERATPDPVVGEGRLSWLDSDPSLRGRAPLVSYLLEATDRGGHTTTHGPVRIAGLGKVPLPLALRPATPNPMRQGTEIGFDLPYEADVRLRIFSIAGRLVRTLVEEKRPAGRWRVGWHGDDETGHSVAPGVRVSTW